MSLSIYALHKTDRDNALAWTQFEAKPQLQSAGSSNPESKGSKGWNWWTSADDPQHSHQHPFQPSIPKCCAAQRPTVARGQVPN